VIDRQYRDDHWQLKWTGHFAKSRSWLLEVQRSRQISRQTLDRDCLQTYLRRIAIA
jgi:hypothetical protein